VKSLSWAGFVRAGPKGALSPTLGDRCPVCRRPLVVGDYTTLLPHGARLATAETGSELHWSCALAISSRR